MESAGQDTTSTRHLRKDSELSAVTDDQTRRASELSEPVSDYEPYQMSYKASPLPPIPQLSSEAPEDNRTRSPVSPPLASSSSRTEVNPDIESQPKIIDDPEVVPAEQMRGPRTSAPQYQESPDNTEKEAYFGAHKTAYETRIEDVPHSAYHNDVDGSSPISSEENRRRKILGLTKRTFIIVIVVLVLVIIGIAVGVGVGVGVGSDNSNSDSSTVSDEDVLYAMGGALDPAYYSTQGAFNGSGIAVADVNFGLDNSLYVFYQKYSGEIEQLIYRADGSWSFVTQVATDAKNATPLSTVAYIVDSVATWQLFYVSNDNVLKQRTQSNASSFQTNIWEDGPLTDLKLRVHDANSAGMQSCYFGNYYGSLDNYDDAIFGPSNGTASTGMNIWYADTNTTFQQYDWTNGQDQWNHTRSWENMNTHAGIGCQSWLTNTTSYVFMVDDTDNLRIWWKDIDTNKTSTASHPINAYTLVEGLSIPNIHPLSSLGYTDFMIYQTDDSTIHGLNITWAAEDTAIAPVRKSTSDAAESASDSQDQWALQSRDAGLGGTHMAITGSQPASGGRQELLFYQATGDDLRLGKRDAAGGDFAFIEVPLGNLDAQIR